MSLAQIIKPMEGRSKVALLTALSNLANRGLTMVMILIAAHWTLPYLGEERVGVWMILLSLAALLSFLDLGVANALTNHVAKARVQGEIETRKAIQGGVLLVGLIAGGVFITLQLTHAVVPWGKLFKLSRPETLAEVEAALRWLYLFFSMQIVSMAGVRVAYGLQEGYRANLVQALLCLVSILAIYILSRLEAGLVAVLMGVFLPVSVAGIFYLGWQLVCGQWGWSGAVIQMRLQARTLLAASGMFFVLQLITLAAWGADSLIVSATLGAAAVLPYALAQRVFQFVSQPIAIMNNALWPAYADAYVSGDKQYISRTTRKSGLLSAVGAVVGVGVMLPISPWLVGVISDGKVELERTFVTLFAVWVLCEVAGCWISTRLNGVGQIRLQVVVMFFFVVVSLPLKVYVLDIYGLEGFLLVGIVGFVGLVLGGYSLTSKLWLS